MPWTSVNGFTYRFGKTQVILPEGGIAGPFADLPPAVPGRVEVLPGHG